MHLATTVTSGCTFILFFSQNFCRSCLNHLFSALISSISCSSKRLSYLQYNSSPAALQIQLVPIRAPAGSEKEQGRPYRDRLSNCNGALDFRSPGEGARAAAGSGRQGHRGEQTAVLICGQEQRFEYGCRRSFFGALFVICGPIVSKSSGCQLDMHMLLCDCIESSI